MCTSQKYVEGFNVINIIIIIIIIIIKFCDYKLNVVAIIEVVVAHS